MELADKEIYLIRHGETDLNKNGIVQGRSMNPDLNATGVAQAQAFFNAYKSVPFDKIYTSALKRTYQTVLPFIELGIPWEAFAGLDELCWGIWEGKPNTERGREAFRALAAQWAAGNYDAKAEGGESPAEVLKRLTAAMDIIASRTAEKTILICMHGRAMRLLLCHLTGKPLSKMSDFPHQNTALYKIIVKNNTYTITEFNNANHLNNLK